MSCFHCTGKRKEVCPLWLLLEVWDVDDFVDTLVRAVPALAGRGRTHDVPEPAGARRR